MFNQIIKNGILIMAAYLHDSRSHSLRASSSSRSSVMAGLSPQIAQRPFFLMSTVLKTAPCRKEAMPHHTDLTLYLSLLPPGGRGAGNRIEEVVGGQVLESPVEDPVLAHQHFGYHGLQIVVDAAPTYSAIGLKYPGMVIMDHLQAITGIGDTEWFAAITQSKLGELDIDRHTAQNKDFQFQFFTAEELCIAGLSQIVPKPVFSDIDRRRR